MTCTLVRPHRCAVCAVRVACVVGRDVVCGLRSVGVVCRDDCGAPRGVLCCALHAVCVCVCVRVFA